MKPDDEALDALLSRIFAARDPMRGLTVLPYTLTLEQMRQQADERTKAKRARRWLSRLNPRSWRSSLRG